MSTPNLPSGTITFLFTDIQGSTQLWQQYPADMPQALQRHHAILRQSIEENDGYVFQIIGDAFCAAFHTIQDGLLAAIDAQRRLGDEEWGKTGPIQVRMALHSGAADVQAGDFISGEYRSGLTLSRAARLLSAGHGGQVLLSLPASELLRDHLPQGIELHDLGLHRLKDLVRPEHIYQAIATDLPSGFPPLKTLDARPHNLPVQLTSFIGRAREIAEIEAALQQPVIRLLTLTGSGGTGKTRLALQSASELIDKFPEGVWFIDLSPVTDPELIPQAVAAAWGLREQPWRPLVEVLLDYTRHKNLLLILDNCEHLIDACASLAQTMLQACSDVKIMATSREPLGVAGEMIFRVAALSLPDADTPEEIETLQQFEAVRLFIDRAAVARLDFMLTKSNARVVAQICRRLDGIPLAIELAAARLRAFSVEQIAERLEDRFRLLTGGSRTSLPRQQTLRALIDWSYNLLTHQEQWLFQRLAVFQGGWSLEAAEAICCGDGIEEWSVLDLLGRLVDRSLVVMDEAGEFQRYRMLDTIRQYADQALQESGEHERWYKRHQEYYRKLSLEADPELRSDRDIFWLGVLEREHDNLRAAIDSSTKWGDACSALTLSGALGYFWYKHGHMQEGLKRTLQAVQMPGAEQHSLELATALQGLGLFYWLNGAYQDALDTLERCISLVRSLAAPAQFILGIASSYRAFSQMRLGNYAAAQDDAQNALGVFKDIYSTYGMAVAYYSLSRISIEQGKLERAKPDLEKALYWSRLAGDRQLIALVLNSLVVLAISNQDFFAAQTLNLESLLLARQLDDDWMVSGALREAGNLAQAMGEYPQAVDYFTQSGEISREQGLTNDFARTRFNLGYLAVLQADFSLARSYLQESLDLFFRLSHRRGQMESLDGFAALAAYAGHLDAAARLLGAVDALFESLGSNRWPVDQLENEKLRQKLELGLGAKEFSKHYAGGRKLSLDQAIAFTADF
jgi:predicted ATPase/class 3 adenylate cyclase